MSVRRSCIVAFLLIVVWIALAGVFGGCTEKPTEPVFDNVFDPQAPGNGDPFDAQAFVAGDRVTVTWTKPAGFAIASLNIRHSTDGQTYTTAGEVDSTKTYFEYTEAVPTATNYFTVQAIDVDGKVSLLSNVTPAEIATPAFVVIGDGSGTTATRHVTLALQTSVGSAYVIADNESFSNADTVAADLENSVLVDRNLGDAAANGDTLTVYVGVEHDLWTPPVAVNPVIVDFDPGFTVAGDPATVGTALVDLEVAAIGLTRMRFARSEEDLAAQSWTEVDADSVAVFEDFALDEDINTQTIYGEFESDFQFAVVSDIEIVPDDLSTAGFSLRDGDITIDQQPVLICDAAATQMRFANAPDFTDAAWIDYADTTSFELSEGAGEKTIYGQFRNHWNDSAPSSVSVLLVDVPLYVSIVDPADGGVVTGGETYTVTGRSHRAGDTYTVDEVGFDRGENEGFQPTTGSVDNWTFSWNVPLLTEDTSWEVRARAHASDGDSATVAVTVTISQLVIVIDEPATDTEFNADTDLSISGHATPHLLGDPLEAVTLTAGGEDVVVTLSDDGSWTATWHIPADAADTAVELEATVTAGAQTTSTTSTINVVP